MKRMVLAVVILVAIVLWPGCFGGELERVLTFHRAQAEREAATQPAAPPIQYIAIHEGGDPAGPVVAAAIDRDADGVPDLDPVTKEIILVPGSKRAIAEDRALAEELDAGAVDLITLIGSICGAGGLAGLVGRIWGKHKPMRQLAETQLKVRGIVESVDGVLKSDKFNAETVTAIREVLATVQETKDGVVEYVKDVKADIDAAKGGA